MPVTDDDIGKPVGRGDEFLGILVGIDENGNLRIEREGPDGSKTPLTIFAVNADVVNVAQVSFAPPAEEGVGGTAPETGGPTTTSAAVGSATSEILTDVGSGAAATAPRGANVHEQRVLAALNKFRRTLGLPLSIFNDVRLAVGRLFEGQSPEEAARIASELLGERRAALLASLIPGDFAPDFVPFTVAALEEQEVTLAGLISDTLVSAGESQRQALEQAREQRRNDILSSFDDAWDFGVVLPLQRIAQSGISLEAAHAETILTDLRDRREFWRNEFIVWFSAQELARAEEGGAGEFIPQDVTLDMTAPLRFVTERLGDIYDVTGTKEFSSDDAHMLLQNEPALRQLLRNEAVRADRAEAFGAVYDTLHATVTGPLANLGLDPEKAALLQRFDRAFIENARRFQQEFLETPVGTTPLAWLGQNKYTELVALPMAGVTNGPELSGDLVQDLGGVVTFMTPGEVAQEREDIFRTRFRSFVPLLEGRLSSEEAQRLALEAPDLEEDFIRAAAVDPDLTPEAFLQERTGFGEAALEQGGLATAEVQFTAAVNNLAATLRARANDPRFASFKDQLIQRADLLERQRERLLDLFREQTEGVPIEDIDVDAALRDLLESGALAEPQAGTDAAGQPPAPAGQEAALPPAQQPPGIQAAEAPPTVFGFDPFSPGETPEFLPGVEEGFEKFLQRQGEGGIDIVEQVLARQGASVRLASGLTIPAVLPGGQTNPAARRFFRNQILTQANTNLERILSDPSRQVTFQPTIDFKKSQGLSDEAAFRQGALEHAFGRLPFELGLVDTNAAADELTAQAQQRDAARQERQAEESRKEAEETAEEAQELARSRTVRTRGVR